VGCHFAETYLTVQGLYTVQFSDLKVSWVRVLLCEGLGIYLPLLGLCFLPVALLLGGKKTPSFFGMRSIRDL